MAGLSEEIMRYVLFRLLEPRKLQEVSTNIKAIEREYTDYFARGIRIVYMGHKSYPNNLMLRLRRDAPSVLFCRGRLDLLRKKTVAIVGSRHPSITSLEIARRLAAELARTGRGFTVVSGNAAGIDRMAHLGALERGGTTALVLPMGILEFAPTAQLRAIPNWESRALVISQFLPPTPWKAYNAMARNKLICGLANGVVVIEAGSEIDENGRMSGSFNAGATALELHVPLFVMTPGMLAMPSLGNKVLIRKGGIELPRDPKTAVKIIMRHIGLNQSTRDAPKRVVPHDSKTTQFMRVRDLLNERLDSTIDVASQSYVGSNHT